MLKVSIATAARLLNKGPQFVRVALQRELVPFGFAVKLQEDGDRYDYYINPAQLCEYLRITEEELEREIKDERDERKKDRNIILPDPLF